MIQKHEERAHEAKDGAQVILFQELFYGPYFCQVQDAQYYSYTELIPDGPTTKRMQDLAKQTGMVIVAPMYEEDAQASGIYYNTAAVIDADGTYLGKYRKTHIPHVKGFWEKFYFRPGNLVSGLRDRRRQGRRLHLLRPALPRGCPGPRPERCRDGVHPVGHVARPVGAPMADRAAQPRRRQRLLRRDDQPRRHREGVRRRRLLRPEPFRRSARQFVGDVGDAHDEELIVRDLDLDKIAEVRNTWCSIATDGPTRTTT